MLAMSAATGGVALGGDVGRALAQTDKRIEQLDAKIEALTETTENNDETVELVRAVREHAGPDFTLALDVGYRWRTADEALDCVRRLEELDLFDPPRWPTPCAACRPT